jgi:hypothetical protein
MGDDGSSEDKPSESRQSRYVGYGVAFGLMAGAIIWTLTDDMLYVGMGLSLGLCVGALAAHFTRATSDDT